MRKGVSPVVATVLLIAIAVISAVAVWYWVAPLTGAQPTGSTAQYAYTVTNVYKIGMSDNCTNFDITNTGGVAIPLGTVFEIRLQTNGTSMSRYVNVSSALAPGAVTRLNVSTSGTGSCVNYANVPQGAYVLRTSSLSISSISGFSDVYFTCA